MWLLAQTPAPAPGFDLSSLLSNPTLLIILAVGFFLFKDKIFPPKVPPVYQPPLPLPVPLPTDPATPAPPQPRPIIDLVNTILPTLLPMLTPLIQQLIESLVKRQMQAERDTMMRELGATVAMMRQGDSATSLPHATGLPPRAV
jgi:hypothetical protein